MLSQELAAALGATGFQVGQMLVEDADEPGRSRVGRPVGRFWDLFCGHKSQRRKCLRQSAPTSAVPAQQAPETAFIVQVRTELLMSRGVLRFSLVNRGRT